MKIGKLYNEKKKQQKTESREQINKSNASQLDPWTEMNGKPTYDGKSLKKEKKWFVQTNNEFAFEFDPQTRPDGRFLSCVGDKEKQMLPR